MLDEEKRISKEEKNQLKDAENNFEKKKEGEKNKISRCGNRAIVLTEIEILDSKKERKKVFNPHDDVIVRMHYQKNNENISKAIFGIEIFNEKNNQLFGFNTSMIKKPVEIPDKKGHIDFKLLEIPFLNGKYKLTPAIADETAKIQYDYWTHASEFIVMNKNFDAFVYGEVNIRVQVESE